MVVVGVVGAAVVVGFVLFSFQNKFSTDATIDWQQQQKITLQMRVVLSDYSYSLRASIDANNFNNIIIVSMQLQNHMQNRRARGAFQNVQW